MTSSQDVSLATALVPSYMEMFNSKDNGYQSCRTRPEGQALDLPDEFRRTVRGRLGQLTST